METEGDRKPERKEPFAGGVPSSVTVIEHAIQNARGAPGADADLIDILAKHLGAIKPDANAVDAAFRAIEKLADNRAKPQADKSIKP